jgi:hypothetical protein
MTLTAEGLSYEIQVHYETSVCQIIVLIVCHNFGIIVLIVCHNFGIIVLIVCHNFGIIVLIVCHNFGIIVLMQPISPRACNTYGFRKTGIIRIESYPCHLNRLIVI